MKVQEMFTGSWLKAGDLAGEEIKKMREVKVEPVGDKEKPVLHFDDGTAMVLNITNANSIRMMHGDETDTWTGKEVVLYQDMVPFRGDIVPAIRIRSEAAQAVTPNWDDPAPESWVNKYEASALSAQQSLDITSPSLSLGATMREVKERSDVLQSMIDAIK